jgi:transposase
LCDVQAGNGNGDRFIDFLHRLRASPQLENENNVMLILDNVAFHHRRDVIAEMAALGFDHHFYSPFFNPIENFFGAWKSGVRASKPRTEVELLAAMRRVELRIPAVQCLNFCLNTTKNCRLCQAGQDYFDN